MNITKVRIKQSSVVIEYTKPDGESHSITSKDRPLPSFVEAVKALSPLLISVCHLPEDYANSLTVTGLTIAEKQEARLVVIVGQKDLPECHSPFNIATPLRFLEHPETEGSYSPPLTDHDVALVETVLAEAKAYVQGKRAQGQLPFEGAGEDDNDGEGEDTTPALPFPAAVPTAPAEPAASTPPPKRARKKREAAAAS